MKVISVVNRKGGVAKTSTVQMIASCLKAKGKKVLMFDLDSQGNLSMFNNAFDQEDNQIGNLLTGKKSKIVHGMLPCNYSLADLEVENSISVDRLKKFFINSTSLKQNYDFVVIDTSPSFGNFERGIFYATNEIVAVLQLDEFG